MAKYALFFSYKPETWDRMIMKPGDRASAARQLIENAGGTLESMYFMLGDRDGFAVFDVADQNVAAGLAVAVTSTGAFSHVETRPLIAAADLAGILESAAAAREVYRPPGE